MSATHQTIWTCNAPGCATTVAFHDPTRAAYISSDQCFPEGWELWHNGHRPYARTLELAREKGSE